MKYSLKKITSISAINDWHGLGREVAKKLENGDAVELATTSDRVNSWIVNNIIIKEN